MRHLHETLRRGHHLRPFGRLQYGLFLKSINLTLDQALAFWKEEFTKKMEPEKVESDWSKAATTSTHIHYTLDSNFSLTSCTLTVSGAVSERKGSIQVMLLTGNGRE